jgi:hypothetical protein
MAMYDIPAFLRKADVAREPEPPARLAPFDACDPDHWNGADGGFTPLGFAAWLTGQPASAWPRTYAELEFAAMSKRVVEWLRRDIGMGRDEALIVMAFCIAMAAMGAADSRQPRRATATSERQHGALLDEAMQHIRDVIELTGANHWPSACLQA